MHVIVNIWDHISETFSDNSLHIYVLWVCIYICVYVNMLVYAIQVRERGEGKGNPLQYSCLENPMDRGAWQATVHGDHKEADMIEQLSHTYRYMHTHTYIHTHTYTHAYIHKHH